MSLLLWRSRSTTNEWKVRYNNLQNKQQDVSVILDTLSGKQQTEVWVSSTITTVPLFPQNFKKSLAIFLVFSEIQNTSKTEILSLYVLRALKTCSWSHTIQEMIQQFSFFKPLKTGGFFVVIRHPFIHLFWLKAPYNDAQWILTRGGHC